MQSSVDIKVLCLFHMRKRQIILTLGNEYRKRSKAASIWLWNYYWYQNWIPQPLISSLWFLPTCRRSVKRISSNRNGCFDWRTDSPRSWLWNKSKQHFWLKTLPFLYFGILTDNPPGSECYFMRIPVHGRVRKPQFSIRSQACMLDNFLIHYGIQWDNKTCLNPDDQRVLHQ